MDILTRILFTIEIPIGRNFAKPHLFSIVLIRITNRFPWNIGITATIAIILWNTKRFVGCVNYATVYDVLVNSCYWRSCLRSVSKFKRGRGLF